MKKRNSARRNERGAILVHVATGLVALMAFSALSVDYGVLWVSRRQVQNAADAGALAAGISLAFVDQSNQNLARSSAVAVAQQNTVWGGVPDVKVTDVTFPPCPSNALGTAGTCVRVNVFRDQRPGGDPLPMFFGQLLGLDAQGVRGTATAQVLTSDQADCVKPWAMPDKWLEYSPVTAAWLPSSRFERYDNGGVLSPADVYIAPSLSGPGTGFRLPDDYGRLLTLKLGSGSQSPGPGIFNPVVLNPAESGGASRYEDDIVNCDGTVVGPGTVLETEPGNMAGPTSAGVQALIEQDIGGWWDATANGGLGSPAGGCVPAGTCTRSPRLVAIPVFDPDVFEFARTSGRDDIVVTNVVGFWIEDVQPGGDIVGHLTFTPSLPVGNSVVGDQSAFMRTVILVR